MSNIDDGGPAFPHDSPGGSYFEGMSLRDWFAGQAIKESARKNYAYRDIARAAYQIADAMLAARKQEVQS